jgi:hypothetical protein
VLRGRGAVEVLATPTRPLFRSPRRRGGEEEGAEDQAFHRRWVSEGGKVTTGGGTMLSISPRR